MNTTETPTPSAAILDRITEAEVCEWMQSRVAKANADCPHGVCAIEICAWDEMAPTITAHGRSNGKIFGIGYNKDTIASALKALTADLAEKKPNPEKLRDEAAELISQAEALESEGAQ